MLQFRCFVVTARYAGALGCLVALAPLSAQSVNSQTADHPPKARGPQAEKASRTDGWQVGVESRATVQYDNNVFLLSPTQLSAVASPSAASTISGRYEGMESANDVIGVSNIGVRLSGPGARGQKLEVSPELSYEFASRNQSRREVAGALSVAQSLGGGRRIRLVAGTTPSHFARNYLSDAVDADANGSISADERIYKRGQYGDYSIGGDFRLPVGGKANKDARALLGVGAGYYVRSYDAPFSIRDLSGPTAAVTIATGNKSPVGLELTYELAALSAARGQQVVLLDEPVYNVDFNGNGSMTDLNARAFVDVDRSRLEHQIGGAINFDAGHRASASVGYDYRIRSFRSTLPYDEADAGRRDKRSGIRGSIRARMAKGVYVTSGVKFLSQRTNRPLGSVLGEEDDYRNLIGSIGLQASF